MPFVDPDDTPRFVDIPAKPISLDEKAGPGVIDTVSAAFRRENTIASVMNQVTFEGEGIKDPDHNPIDALEPNSIYVRDHLERFAGSVNADETDRIKAQIDREIADSRTIESAGVGGVVASLAAGVIDPVSLLPGGAIAKTAKGVSILRTASNVAAAGAVAGATSEAVLQATQERELRKRVLLI